MKLCSLSIQYNREIFLSSRDLCKLYSREELKDAAERADRAADELMIRGGDEGNLINSKGKVCLLGAIAVAMPNVRVEEDFGEYCQNTIKWLVDNENNKLNETLISCKNRTLVNFIALHVGCDSVTDWNDYGGYYSDYNVTPTDGERIELLRGVAKDIRELIGDNNGV